MYMHTVSILAQVILAQAIFGSSHFGSSHFDLSHLSQAMLAQAIHLTLKLLIYAQRCRCESLIWIHICIHEKIRNTVFLIFQIRNIILIALIFSNKEYKPSQGRTGFVKAKME